jgi:endonuclease III
MSSQDAVVRALLDLYGETFSEELGIAIVDNIPTSLFQLLCASLLFSARISTTIALAAARALYDQGWTSAEKMADSTWEERTRTLNKAGYARYDESTSRMLGDTVELLLERYGGDLRELRKQAERDPSRERRLLKEFKGIGDVGADIFFREAQVAWEELFPFADDRSLAGARKLGLPDTPQGLLELVGRDDYARLVAALVRVQLDDGLDVVRQRAEEIGEQ